MKTKQEGYYAKIMLFGEYSVMCNSMGLTIPYARFKGDLSFFNDEQYTDYDFAVSSNNNLKRYYIYLKDLIQNRKLGIDFNIEQLRQDIDDGLYFESSIPQGYGIGSSGALCAALYENYSENGARHKRFIGSNDILKLKEIFSLMESYFHGVSSGIDPLLCYIKFPLLIKSQSEIQMIGIPRNKFNEGGAIFLINTNRPGKTGPLVKIFFDNCKNNSFKELVYNELIPINNACIEALINGESTIFFHKLSLLSRFQFNHFQQMIPEEFNNTWATGLETGKYLLKLCGSGGGGFLLGITSNYEEARQLLNQQGINTILVYKSQKTISK